MSIVEEKYKPKIMIVCALSLGLLLFSQAAADPFSFVVTADMRMYSGSGKYDSSRYFRGVCEAIAEVDAGAFMVIVGDLDPPNEVQWTIEQVFGNAYPWYPVVGNHDLPGGGREFHRSSNMEWLRNYNFGGNSLAYIVNVGPPGCEETTYSFDYQHAHFVVLNVYYDGKSDAGTDGDIADALYDWLADDLAASAQEHIFVFGHEPAYPQPDADSGRKRHIGDSLDKYPVHRDRFWSLLRDQGVVAYFCGHSHNYSAEKIDDVWQWDAGHARGAGDTGAPSTFLIVEVTSDVVKLKVYRDAHDGHYDYDDIVHSLEAFLPVELSSFVAHQEEGAVVLKWIAESEIVNRGFVLERRDQDTHRWDEIASYRTHIELMERDDDAKVNTYEYVDSAVQLGFPYEYRLAVVSLEGQREYLGTVKLHW